jgi:hypothetical protein
VCALHRDTVTGQRGSAGVAAKSAVRFLFSKASQVYRLFLLTQDTISLETDYDHAVLQV